MLKQFENLIEEAKEEEYSNPLAPSSYPQYGTELDVKYCSFYLKTGACRFGDRCSRHHMKPPSSDTILLPAMFQHISLGEDFTNDLDIDSCLEHEDDDTNKTFTDFFWDVFPEFQAVGHVTMFKVCCNHEPHLRGNVYVQYREEREAIKAYAKFNGRFYASRQISCEFVKIEKWKSAICGQFHRQRCPKGKNCNFLHVFKNPGGLFMVHGSEVSGGPTRANLSAAGENAIRNLDNHPVVQAARARQRGFPQLPSRPQQQSPNWVPSSQEHAGSPGNRREHPGSPGNGRVRGTPSPAHRPRACYSPSRGSPHHHRASPLHRAGSSPAHRGASSPAHRGASSPAHRATHNSPSPHHYSRGNYNRANERGRDRARAHHKYRSRSRSPRAYDRRDSRDRSPRRRR